MPSQPPWGCTLFLRRRQVPSLTCQSLRVSGSAAGPVVMTPRLPWIVGHCQGEDKSEFQLASVLQAFSICPPAEIFPLPVGCSWCRCIHCSWPAICKYIMFSLIIVACPLVPGLLSWCTVLRCPSRFCTVLSVLFGLLFC